MFHDMASNADLLEKLYFDMLRQGERVSNYSQISHQYVNK